MDATNQALPVSAGHRLRDTWHRLFRRTPESPSFGPRADTILDAEDLIETRDPLAARSMLYVLLAAMAIAILWAAFAHVDKVVVAQGRIATHESRITVQPFELSVVRSIDVVPGQLVKAGQVLATLDPTFADADTAELNDAVQSYGAGLARMQAELDGKTSLPPPTNHYEEFEANLFQQRLTEFQARVDSLKQSIGRYQSALDADDRERPGMEEALKMAQERVTIRSTLAEQGWNSRLQVLEAKGDLVTKQNQLHDLQGSHEQLVHQLEGARKELDSYVDEWRRKLSDDYVTSKRSYDSAVERLAKAERRTNLVKLTAPADAIVLDIAKRSAGAVVKEAEPLVTLVPVGDKLEATADIETRDVIEVRANDKVQMKLEALPWQRHGRVTGKLMTVSRDTVEDSETEAGMRDHARLVYRGRISIDKVDLRDVPDDFQLIPGMRITAKIRVGERTVLSYLMDPITSTLSQGLREP